MGNTIDAFITYLHKIKRTADNTLISYRRDLLKLGKFLQEKGVSGAEDITVTDLKAFIKELEEQHLKAATISRHIASIKAFFHYLYKENLVQEDISDSLHAPKIEKRIPGIMTKEEAISLVEQPCADTPKEIRDRAMLELLYATGIRVTELLNLEEADVNLKMGYIICKDENKERAIPFGNKAREALLQYRNHARSALLQQEDVNVFFVNCSGQPMSRQGFWKLLKSYARKAGISAEITPHTLRLPLLPIW